MVISQTHHKQCVSLSVSLRHFQGRSPQVQLLTLPPAHSQESHVVMRGFFLLLATAAFTNVLWGRSFDAIFLPKNCVLRAGGC